VLSRTDSGGLEGCSTYCQGRLGGKVIERALRTHCACAPAACSDRLSVADAQAAGGPPRTLASQAQRARGPGIDAGTCGDFTPTAAASSTCRSLLDLGSIFMLVCTGPFFLGETELS
jgi:hypothetical protein